MEILVTNDDGIFAPGLWRLVKELRTIARVIVATPDREQSGSGTAVTFRQPLRVQKVRPLVPEVESYSVEGTPADSVILALEKLVTAKIDLVVSGINSGANMGDDVLISGTVGAALQGYLRGYPAMAVSLGAIDSSYLDNAARLAAILAKKIGETKLTGNFFLNVNLPTLPLAEIKGIKVTRLAGQTHINTVDEGHDGRKAFYWLVREKLDRDAPAETDIHAIEQGHISITPLHTELLRRSSSLPLENLCSEAFRELKS